MGKKTADVIGLFQEGLAQYRAYAEYFSPDSGILSVSFQCLTDVQSKDVTSLLGVVGLSGIS
jgi:hypothetical protein